jgi:hypothetical protein
MAEGAGTKYGWRDTGAAFEPRDAAVLAGAVGILAFLVVEWVFRQIYGSPAHPNVENWVKDVVILAHNIVRLGLLFVTLAAQAYVARTDFLDEQTANMRQALGFALKRAGTLAAIPLVPLVLALIFALPMVVAALLGEIPYVGWLLYPLAGFLGFIGLVLTVLALVLFVFTLYLGPGIVAVRREGAFEALIDVVGSLRGRGIVGLLLGAAATSITACVFFAATTLMYGISNKLMGEKFDALFQGVPFISETWAYSSLPLALVLLLLFLIAGGYVLSVFSSAGTLTFLWTIADEDWDMPLEPALPPEPPALAAAAVDESQTPPALAAVAEPAEEAAVPAEPAEEPQGFVPAAEPAEPDTAPKSAAEEPAAPADEKPSAAKGEQIFVPDEGPQA